ncbi:MAG: hypothetical protein U9N51_10670 [Bacteroidota bacterium]|nr:hypothetical protein [Bacteroidota bacterium]
MNPILKQIYERKSVRYFRSDKVEMQDLQEIVRAVWTALYPYEERMLPIIDACHIPNHLMPLNIIPIGVPIDENKPKDKYKLEKNHINQWKNQ